MGKDFKSKNPLDMGNTPKTPPTLGTQTPLNTPNTPASDNPTPTQTTVDKPKVGRPKVKEGDYKKINIAVPVEVYDQMEVAKLKYGNSLTAYVNAVVRADLEANYEQYLKIQTILNS